MGADHLREYILIVFITGLLCGFCATGLASEQPVFSLLPNHLPVQESSSHRLFERPNGGIWTYEHIEKSRLLVNRQLGSLSQGSSEPPWLHLSDSNDDFWSFEDRKIIRFSPYREAQIEMTLPPGPAITSMGEIQDWLWFSDNKYLYFYQPSSQQLSSFLLADIVKVESDAHLSITDIHWGQITLDQFLRPDASFKDKLKATGILPKHDDVVPQSILIVVESSWLNSNYRYILLLVGILLATATIVLWRRLSRIHHLQKGKVVRNTQTAAITEKSAGFKAIDRHPSGFNDEQQQWLTQVMGIIESQCNDASFTTAKLAKQLFISERSLQRRFKQMTGSTVTEAVNLLRLAKASKLLLEGASVSYVAYQCGFNDHSYFSQKFKQQYGVTPSQFALQRQ